MTSTTINIPIYDIDIIVVIADDFKRANDEFKKLDLDEDDFKAYAHTILFEGDFRTGEKSEIYMLLNSKDLSYNTVLHELMHVVTLVCMDKGIKLRADNDEPLAYLQGYIGERVFEFVKKFI